MHVRIDFYPPLPYVYYINMAHNGIQFHKLLRGVGRRLVSGRQQVQLRRLLPRNKQTNK